MSLLRQRIIDRQKRITHAGEIRIADVKGEKSPGRPLEHFRLTSSNEAYLKAASEVYGGEVVPWVLDGKPNGFQIFTKRKQIKALFSTHEKDNGDLESLSLSYDMWKGDTHVRECDGCIVKVWKDCGRKDYKGKPVQDRVEEDCICRPQEEGFVQIPNQTCAMRARAAFMLSEFPTLGLWHFLTGSETFTQEVLGLLDQIQMLGMMGQLIPVTLTITMRTKRTGPNEVNSKFPVVKIEIDPQPVSLPQLLSGVRQQALAMPATSYGGTAALESSAPSLMAPSKNGLTENQKLEAKQYVKTFGISDGELVELKGKVTGAGLIFTNLALTAKEMGITDGVDFFEFIVNAIKSVAEAPELVEGELVEEDPI
jgi:hypothetical protein